MIKRLPSNYIVFFDVPEMYLGPIEQVNLDGSCIYPDT
jgi:hypothetical protein